MKNLFLALMLANGTIPQLFACCPITEIVDQGIKLSYFDNSISIERTVVLAPPFSTERTEYDISEEVITDRMSVNSFGYEFGERLLKGKFSTGNTGFFDNRTRGSHEAHYDSRITLSAPVIYNKKNKIQWPPPPDIASFPIIPMTTKTVFQDPLDRSLVSDEDGAIGTFKYYKPSSHEFWDTFGSKIDQDEQKSWDAYSYYNAEPVFYDFSCVKRTVYADIVDLIPAHRDSSMIVQTSIVDPVESSTLSVFCKNYNPATRLLDDSVSNGADANLSVILNFSDQPKCEKIEVVQEMCHPIVRFQPLEITIKYYKI